MDLYTKLLTFSFVTYLGTIAVHFATFSHEQEQASRESNPWHQHDLAAGTPAHHMLKHSHARWDPSELLGGGGGDLGGGAMWAGGVAAVHEVEEEVTEVGHAHDAADAKHARLVCDPAGDGSEQGLVYWHAAAAADDAWSSPWKRLDGEAKQYVVFESDNGGWNNVRMALEAVFVFARALVMQSPSWISSPS